MGKWVLMVSVYKWYGFTWDVWYIDVWSIEEEKEEEKEEEEEEEEEEENWHTLGFFSYYVLCNFPNCVVWFL
jgi:hypothetical protein